MSFPPPEYIPYLTYAAPPLVGAFIGYVTNRIAIRMLFRPLKPWRIFGFRVPMTPGVIPSQRYRLADNMGEVVGDHLLTSKEIGKALQAGKFQQHLLNVIAERVGAILHSDLPSLPEMIPDKFAIYREFGIRSLKQYLRNNINNFIQSAVFANEIDESLSRKMDDLLDRKIEEIVDGHGREAAYSFIEGALGKMLASSAMEVWLNGFIRRQAYDVLQQEKSINQLLPESLVLFVDDVIRRQTPTMLKKLAAILQEPDVRDSIVRGACGGVENFIQSLGPMAPMAQNFISMELVDQKVREYLDEKEDDIVQWLSSDDLQKKVATILAERFSAFINKPLVEVINTGDADTVEDFCNHLAQQLLHIIRGPELQKAISGMIQNNIETHLENGERKIGTALTDLLGESGVSSLRKWLIEESRNLLRSPETMKTIGNMIDHLVDALLARRIGKLSNFLPSDVRREIYIAIQKLTSTMLAKEVPGLVESLDIRTIVAEKLNSLDLLRLEQLLLSIMEEQFKYINLFGALLGFLIGCLNLVLFKLQ